jgi:NitT/TauT family transport system substrate-binding protein
MYRNRLDGFYAFAQLCINCSTRIISRRPIEHFTWASFVGKRVFIPDGSPTPWMLQDGVIRRAGVDPMKISFIRDFLSAEAMALFRGGLGDFILAGPPAAEQLVADGVGVRVACLSEAGRLPWSVYYSTPEFLDRADNLAGRFTKAITRALRWILTHDPTEAPGVFAKHFPQYRPELVAAAVRACREEGAWTDTARLDPSALNYWQEMIVEAALIDAPYEYADIFDSRAVDWAEAQLAK